MLKGLGGDGGCSFGGMNIRNRNAMLDAINFEWGKSSARDKDFDLNFGQEDVFFLTRLKEIEKAYPDGRRYKIATPAETRLFGAGGDWVNESVLVASSTVSRDEYI